MDNLLIIDGHNMIHKNLHASLKKDGGSRMTEAEIVLEKEFTLWKSYMMKSIFKAIRTTKPTEVIYAADFGKSWRYGIFPGYKGARKIRTAGSSIDMKEFFKVYNTFIGELMYAFPNIKFIHVDGCEGDDVIGAVVHNGWSDYDSITIWSSDSDYLQLQKYANVRQFSTTPSRNDYITTPDAYINLQVKILAGDGKDSIPNVRPLLGPKMAKDALSFNGGLDEWMRDRAAKDVKLVIKKAKTALLLEADTKVPTDDEVPGMEAQLVEQWKAQYELNTKLIDLSLIPSDIQGKILDAIQAYPTSPCSSGHVINLCMAYGLVSAMSDFQMIEHLIGNIHG